MTNIDLYKYVPKNELIRERVTSEGKKYTIDHSGELIVNMRFKGEGASNANSQGWERNSSYYFKELQNSHPEFFSKKNNALIDTGRSPIVDEKFAKCFPQYNEYKGEVLVHHHIGQDGQAVALPQSIHKGYGEIHSVEHDLGITDMAKEFSMSCEKRCGDNPALLNKTSDQFRTKSEDKHFDKDNNIGNERCNSSNSVREATHSNDDVKTIHVISPKHEVGKEK